MLRLLPAHLQRTVAYFLGLDHYDTAIHRMRIEYKKRHEVMAAAIKREGLNRRRIGFRRIVVLNRLDANTPIYALRDGGVLIDPDYPFFAYDDRPCRFSARSIHRSRPAKSRKGSSVRPPA
uniref:hypothetical protein n=1 Tax=Aminobacter niigataensis TaxID=83265 RepID=UPI002852D483|nr:hypothetical protein [Aminobacter niigataensis]WMD00204.1 hypothetical protein RAR13_28470 [Aminobacter niigataensis]